VRDEQQDVDEEGKQRDKESGEGENEESQEVTGRVCGRVEMSSNSE
jgi:hypothetical protein